MELFGTDGHLTQAGLEALVANELDEMGRLEAAEHLSFCDSCLVVYTELLCDDSLMTPKKELKPGIMRRLRQKAGRVMWSRYGTAVAAAALALVMWGVGTLALPAIQRQRNDTGDQQVAADADAGTGQSTPDAAPAAEAGDESLGDRFARVMDNTQNGINNFFDGLLPPKSAAAQQGPAASEQQRQEEDRKEREKLFERKPGPANQNNTAGQNDAGNDNSTTD